MHIITTASCHIDAQSTQAMSDKHKVLDGILTGADTGQILQGFPLSDFVIVGKCGYTH